MSQHTKQAYGWRCEVTGKTASQVYTVRGDRTNTVCEHCRPDKVIGHLLTDLNAKAKQEATP